MTGAQFWILGVNTYLSTTREIQIINGSMGGCTASYAATNTTAWTGINCIKALAPDLTILCLGINDIANARTGYDTDMQSIISAAQISGSVLLLSWVPSGTTAYDNTASSYRAMFRQLAKTNGLPVIETEFKRWPTYAITNAQGWMADTVHPTNTGYAELAQTVCDYLRK